MLGWYPSSNFVNSVLDSQVHPRTPRRSNPPFLPHIVKFGLLTSNIPLLCNFICNGGRAMGEPATEREIVAESCGMANSSIKSFWWRPSKRVHKETTIIEKDRARKGGVVFLKGHYESGVWVVSYTLSGTVPRHPSDSPRIMQSVSFFLGFVFGVSGNASCLFSWQGAISVIGSRRPVGQPLDQSIVARPSK